MKSTLREYINSIQQIMARYNQTQSYINTMGIWLPYGQIMNMVDTILY